MATITNRLPIMVDNISAPRIIEVSKVKIRDRWVWRKVKKEEVVEVKEKNSEESESDEEEAKEAEEEEEEEEVDEKSLTLSLKLLVEL